MGLNRTFYGIEISVTHYLSKQNEVLIVPFMELKYEIYSTLVGEIGVLIVPFMELKFAPCSLPSA